MTNLVLFKVKFSFIWLFNSWAMILIWNNEFLPDVWYAFSLSYWLMEPLYELVPILKLNYGRTPQICNFFTIWKTYFKSKFLNLFLFSLEQHSFRVVLGFALQRQATGSFTYITSTPAHLLTSPMHRWGCFSYAWYTFIPVCSKLPCPSACHLVDTILPNVFFSFLSSTYLSASGH